MDKLSKYLRWIEHRKRDIIKQGKDRAEEWQDFFTYLELFAGRIDGQFHENIHRDKRETIAWNLLFVYEQIEFAQRYRIYQSAGRRKLTLAQKYWHEREKMEHRFFKHGRDWHAVKDMPRFSKAKAILQDYPHPHYSPNSLKVKLTPSIPGRPERDLRHWLYKVLNEPLRLLAPKGSFRTLRSIVLEKLFGLLS